MSDTRPIARMLEREGAENVDVQSTADNRLIITMDLVGANEDFSCEELEFDSVDDVISWMRRKYDGKADVSR